MESLISKFHYKRNNATFFFCLIKHVMKAPREYGLSAYILLDLVDDEVSIL